MLLCGVAWRCSLFFLWLDENEERAVPNMSVSLIRKRARLTANKNLSAASLCDALEKGLKQCFTLDLNVMLEKFKGTTWKTASSLSVPGLSSAAPLFEQLLLAEPTAARALSVRMQGFR